MARTRNVSTKVTYGWRKVPRKFRKGTKQVFGKIGKEKTIEKSRVPRKISSEQIVAGMKTDAARLKGLKAIEKGRSVRTAALTAGTNISQGLSGLTAGQYANAYNSTNAPKLNQLVSGGIESTQTSRDEDDSEGSSEVM